MIVADTCVLFSLYNKNEWTEQAEALFDLDSNWIFPSLWREEYANILARLIKKHSGLEAPLLKSYKEVASQLAEGERIVDTYEALKLAVHYNISVYDAHFIALAKSQSAYLITEDKEILNNCPEFSCSLKSYLS